MWMRAHQGPRFNYNNWVANRQTTMFQSWIGLTKSVHIIQARSRQALPVQIKSLSLWRTRKGHPAKVRVRASRVTMTATDQRPHKSMTQKRFLRKFRICGIKGGLQWWSKWIYAKNSKSQTKKWARSQKKIRAPRVWAATSQGLRRSNFQVWTARIWSQSVAASSTCSNSRVENSQSQMCRAS